MSSDVKQLVFADVGALVASFKLAAGVSASLSLFAGCMFDHFSDW